MIRFQPLLYLATFIAAVIVIVTGDFANYASYPIQYRDSINNGPLWVWAVLSLGSPLVALLSLQLIVRGSNIWTYRGFWFRLAADFGQFVAMVMYCVLRVKTGDFHLYSLVVLFAATIFVGNLVRRDIRRLIKTERLASKIHRQEGH